MYKDKAEVDVRETISRLIKVKGILTILLCASFVLQGHSVSCFGELCQVNAADCCCEAAANHSVDSCCGELAIFLNADRNCPSGCEIDTHSHREVVLFEKSNQVSVPFLRRIATLTKDFIPTSEKKPLVQRVPVVLPTGGYSVDYCVWRI